LISLTARNCTQMEHTQRPKMEAARDISLLHLWGLAFYSWKINSQSKLKGGGRCIDTYFQVQLIADCCSQVACKPRPAFDAKRSDANWAGNRHCVVRVDQWVSAAAGWDSKQPKSVAF
jgi:hypothetical protein